ncbi:hypothetical protein ACRALDRAFT_208109 [Sodiomyces alcalophilus JCM 7366]|uniref:uncharacterized protein n=1 Tax=Sodiomyces alcalophilus JCM 7366 TaxID=591952 RepID=UPI0039B425CD
MVQPKLGTPDFMNFVSKYNSNRNRVNLDKTLCLQILFPRYLGPGPSRHTHINGVVATRSSEVPMSGMGAMHRDLYCHSYHVPDTSALSDIANPQLFSVIFPCYFSPQTHDASPHRHQTIMIGQTRDDGVTEAPVTVHKKPGRVYGRRPKGKAREPSAVQIGQLDLYSGASGQPAGSDPNETAYATRLPSPDAGSIFGLIGDGWTTAPHTSEREDNTQSDDEFLPPHEKISVKLGDLFATSDRSNSISIRREESFPGGEVEATHSDSRRDLVQLIGDLLTSPAPSNRGDAGSDDSRLIDVTSPPSPRRSRIPLIGDDWSSVLPSDKISEPELQSFKSSQSQENQTTQDTLGADWSSWANLRISPSPEDAGMKTLRDDDAVSSNQPSDPSNTGAPVAADRNDSPRNVIHPRSRKTNRPALENPPNSCLDPYPEDSSSKKLNLDRKPADIEVGTSRTRKGKRNADVAAPKMPGESPQGSDTVQILNGDRANTAKLDIPGPRTLVGKPEASSQTQSARRLPRPHTAKRSTLKKIPEKIARRISQSPELLVQDSQSSLADVPPKPSPDKTRVQGAQSSIPMQNKRKKPRQIAKKPFDPNAPLDFPSEGPSKRRQRNARTTAKTGKKPKSKTTREPPGRPTIKKKNHRAAQQTSLGLTETNDRDLIGDQHKGDVACIDNAKLPDTTLGSCGLQKGHREKDPEEGAESAKIKSSPSNSPLEPPARSPKETSDAKTEENVRTRPCEPNQAVEDVVSTKQNEASTCQGPIDELFEDVDINAGDDGGDDGTREYTSPVRGDDDSEYIPVKREQRPACEAKITKAAPQKSFVISISSDISSDQSDEEKQASCCEEELLPSPDRTSDTLPVSPEVSPPSATVMDQPVVLPQSLGSPNINPPGGTQTPPLSPRFHPTRPAHPAQPKHLGRKPSPSSEFLARFCPPQGPVSPEKRVITCDQTETLNGNFLQTPQHEAGPVDSNLTVEPSTSTLDSGGKTLRSQNGFARTEGLVSTTVSQASESPTDFLGNGLRQARKRENDLRVIESPRKRVRFRNKIAPGEDLNELGIGSADRHGVIAALSKYGSSKPSLPRHFVPSPPTGDGYPDPSPQEDTVPKSRRPESAEWASSFKENLEEHYRTNGRINLGSRLCSGGPELNHSKTRDTQPNAKFPSSFHDEPGST